jgi:hypothetical protein
MKTRTLILILAAVAGGGTAWARAPEAKTREQVRTEATAARQAGTIEVGDTAGLQVLLSTPSQRSRADVHAEAVAANKAGTLAYGDGPLLNRLLWAPSTPARAQVQAEAIEARRLGLMAYGEAEARVPTPAELESVRQAGLRAIGVATMAHR